METDLTSVIIGLASLAIFLLPIGYYQLHEKKSLKEAKKKFLKKADDLAFQAGDLEVLRNRASIGIGKNHEELLYVNGNQFQLIELSDVVKCSNYKSHKKDLDSDDGVIQQIGIRIKLLKGLDVKLPIYEGKEGTMVGDENVITQRWISRINLAHKELEASVNA
ncbi:hypothetical protein [Rhodohalobacter sp.]|uniref:hypothetical protein n=1 Tax=Rhodohalobacter sp. TaxID=1974210 RepID=UPI002ACE7565|nr:hypothetical protein [Rhodohalobacter sp.]